MKSLTSIDFFAQHRISKSDSAWQTELARRLMPLIIQLTIGIVATLILTEIVIEPTSLGQQVGKIGILMMALLMWVFLKRGHVHTVAVVMNVSSLIAACLGVWLHNGHWVYLLIFLMITMYSWMLLSRKWALLFTFCTLVDSFLLIYIKLNQISLPGSDKLSQPLVYLIAGLCLCGTAILAAQIVRLLSEQAAIQNEFQKTLERFEALASSIDEVFLTMSLDNQEIQYVTPNIEKITGISAADFIEHPSAWRSMVHPDDQHKADLIGSQTTNDLLQEVMEEIRITLPTRETRWLWMRAHPIVDKSGTPVARAGLASDITERKLAEIALKENTDQLRAIIDTLPAWIALVDREMRYQLVNQYHVDSFGIPRDQIEGHHISEFLNPDVSNVMLEHGYRALTGEEGLFEISLQNRSGKSRQISMRYVPIYKGTEVSEICVLGQDITDQRAIETMLHREHELDSLGLLAGGVAHDFNNLLTAMLGQGAIALRRLDPEDAAHRNIEKMISAAEHAALLTNQMLTFSGRTRFEIGPQNVNEIIKENIQLFLADDGKQIAVKTELMPKLPSVEADPAQLQQLIMNLLINAGDAIIESGKSGQITVTTTTRDVDQDERRYSHYTGVSLEANRYVVLTIQDSGVGLDAHVLDHIFDPFFSTKSNGNGLGLATVIGTVRAHKGGLLVESDEANGTTFEVLLPAAGQREATEIIDQVASSPPLALSTSMLVIDDEIYLTEMVVDALEDFSIKVYTANSGMEGIALYQEHREQIEFVLLDLSMLGLSGIETCQRLREIDPAIHVCLASGFSEARLEESLVGQPTVTFMQKPYSIDKIVEMVTAITSEGESDQQAAYPFENDSFENNSFEDVPVVHQHPEVETI